MPVWDTSSEDADFFAPQAQRTSRAGNTSQTVPMPALPQELLDDILSHMRGNKRAIDSCSLVCRVWAASTTRILFSELRWPRCHHWWPDPHATDAKYARCVCDDSQPDLHTLTDFLRTAPRVCTAALDLQVSFKRVDRARATLTSLNVHSLISALDVLPNVRHVALHSVVDARSSSAGDQRSGRQLNALTLTRTILDPVVIQTLANYFECIGELVVDHPRNHVMTKPTRTLAPSTAPRTRVDTLQIQSTTPGETASCLKILKPAISSANIKALVVGQVATEAHRLALEEFVQDASSLQSLQFRVSLWSSAFVTQVSRLTARKRLLAGTQSDWASAISLFRTSPAPTALRVLRIDIHVHGDSELLWKAAGDEVLGCLRPLDWSLLDGVVARFERLEKICLSIIASETIDAERVREQFKVILEKRLNGRTFAIVEVMVV